MSGEREGAREEGDQDDLSPVGARAARNALLELVPALVQPAKDLVGGRLSDPELSPRMPARELNISVRTLHRAAFAATDESVTAHIRHQRLEQARLALTGPAGHPRSTPAPRTLPCRERGVSSASATTRR
ncbi:MULTISPECIES: hypothetical protein [unclassified Streptomyces]|uniref:hypothetical protein n=1 Tax=unclassified Streptomyces TaxID=2593676 RepID=UPI00403D0599